MYCLFPKDWHFIILDLTSLSEQGSRPIVPSALTHTTQKHSYTRWGTPQDASFDSIHLFTYIYIHLLISLPFCPFSVSCIWLCLHCSAKGLSFCTDIDTHQLPKRTSISYYPLECFFLKIYLHLHPPVGLWPLLNTWLFGVFSSLKLFGQLPYPTGNMVLSCKELTATGRFYLQSMTHMYQIPTVSYPSGSGALCSRWMDNCRHMDNSYHRRRCEVTLEAFGERIRAQRHRAVRSQEQ